MSAMNDIKDIKVKCFNSRTLSGIETSMNEWLKNNDLYVVDVKYSSINDTTYRYYSVLVIYREN